MKGLTFNAPDSARNATFAHDAETKHPLGESRS
jgi:hypothetical protein